MKSLWIAFGCIALATAGLVLGFASNGLEILSPTYCIIGIFWVIALFRRWRGISSVAFMVFACSAAYATWRGFSALAMLAVIVAALSAWDLDAMIERFRQVDAQTLMPDLERRHFIRLGVIDGAGFLLGVAALTIKLRYSFVLILLLGLMVMVGVSQLVFYLRRSSG